MTTGEREFRLELRDILEDRGLSQRELAKLTRKHAGWGSQGTISLQMSGELPFTLGAMEAICSTLHLEPMDFAEYRMAKLRHDLSPVHVGWPAALRALRKVDG